MSTIGQRRLIVTSNYHEEHEYAAACTRNWIMSNFWIDKVLSTLLLSLVVSFLLCNGIITCSQE
jgi:hypothetical protein